VDKERVLVLGAGGMVGSSVVRNAPPQFEVIPVFHADLDLRDFAKVTSLLSAVKPHSIVLAAAKVGGIKANFSNQKDFLLENLNIQNTVIKAALEMDVQSLVFLGSSCIYPRMANQPISEDALLTGPLEPTNEGYALAKIAGIKLISYLAKSYGKNYFSLMPTNLYGPNDNFDLDSSHVPAALMRKFHQAKIEKQVSVSVWGTGNPRREFMHVDDMASASWFFLQKEAPGELINVGTGSDITIQEFADLMAEVIGFNGEIKYNDMMPDGVKQKLLDVSKANNLGWSHQIGLRDGLTSTYEWLENALRHGNVRGWTE
jgi:GDP-L-fucose synthase